MDYNYMQYDITFCLNFECPRHNCRRHQINTPQDEPFLSKANMLNDGNTYEKCSNFRAFYTENNA